MVPAAGEEIKEKFSKYALETALSIAKHYPSQIRDLIISRNTDNFIDNTVAIMVMDILYGNGTFKTLTENEMVTSNLIMFSDILPQN